MGEVYDAEDVNREGPDPMYRFAAGVLIAAAGAAMGVGAGLVSLGIACGVVAAVLVVSSLIELADEIDDEDDPSAWGVAGWPVPHDLQPPELRKRTERGADPDVDDIERWLRDQ